MVGPSLGLWLKDHVLERSGQGSGRGPPFGSFLPPSLPPSLLSLINSPICIFSYWGASYEREEGGALRRQGRVRESRTGYWSKLRTAESDHVPAQRPAPAGPLCDGSLLLGPFTFPGPGRGQGAPSPEGRASRSPPRGQLGTTCRRWRCFLLGSRFSFLSQC